MLRFTIILLLAGALGLPCPSRLADAADRNPRKPPLQLVLQYDFSPERVTTVVDGSARHHNAALTNGEVVYGLNKNAVKFDGTGVISIANLPDTLNPASRSLTVGAFCRPASPDGVLVALGDKTDGFSLYLKEGVPWFVVRANGELFKVAATEPVNMDQWVHLAGTLDAMGKLSLVVDGWPVATVQGRLISHKPSRGFYVGANLGSPIGEYASPFHWKGLIQDIRLYWGVVERNENRDLWGDWANLAGCGCKK